MTAPTKVESAAKVLRDAADAGTPCAPVRGILETEIDVDLAYDVQRLNTDMAIAAGRRVGGRKIGLTSAVVQSMFNVHQPDFGTLFVDMCFADGVEIPPGRMLQPRAEAEVALVLEHDLDKGEHCIVDIINAAAYVVPSIELVDSRITGWDLTIVDTVADNASAGLYVVGTRPVSLTSIDLLSLPMSMTRNSEEVSTGVGSACLGNPLHAALWLANTMCERGTPLRAGECLMTGALGPMVPVSEGDVLTANFGPLGSVTTKLAGEDT